MSIYDPIKIVRLYLFGTDTPSTDDYSQHIRPWNANIGTNQAKVPYDRQAYMETGAGRYAYPALFKAIEKIFNRVTGSVLTFQHLGGC